MAQEIVSSLLLKLADVVFKEAITLYGVKGKVESVERELRWIPSFLKDADSKSKGDSRVQIWVKDVREVSFLIEDVIDTFLLEVESLSLKKPGICNTLKRVCKKPMKLVAMHNLDSVINNIHARLKEIQENKERYGIENLSEGPSTVAHVKQRIYPETDNIDIVGVDIVGVDADKNNIIELLLDEHTPRRSVVSIVGIGRLGNYTLAIKVYNSEKVRNHFEVRVWLNISREFNTTDILKKMIQKLFITLEEHEKEEEHFIPKIKEVLEGKRYLVVLDDIWMGSDLCNEMKKMNVLPDVNNGSRVLITTRFFEVAKKADPKSDPYQFRFLNEEESLDLLFKKAYVDKNTNGSYPHDLLEPAKIISKKCGGLPLALVVVGGLLSTKPQTGNAWNKEIATLQWQTGENACMKILATSYEDLPTNLKSCFVYLASFPEDWVYDAKLIIQLWVAEGFIPCDEPGTMEEIAEKYLEELAQRCMIQNLKRSKIDDSITQFRVHDLLHDLAIQEAKQKSFLKVFSTRADFENNTDARRATFQLEDSSWEDVSFEQNKLIGYIKPNVRTLIFFGKIIPFGSEFMLLKILVINGYTCTGDGNPYWGSSLKMLFHLRCLMFEACLFKHFILPIDHLHNLQTLEIMYCEGIEVPMSLWGIKTLRHVFVNNGIEIPIGSRATLPNLQTLKKLTIDKPGIELLQMPGLRELHLCNQYDSWGAIIIVVIKLQCLETLTLEGSWIPLEITTKFPSYNHLRTLYLNGAWQTESGAINAVMFPLNLISLTLVNSQIDQHVMLEIQKLQCLRLLSLFGAYNGKQLISSQGGFPQLQKLELSWIYKLEEWIIEKAAMPMLNDLKICCCGKLGMVPDLRHVCTLNVLTLRCMPKEFNSRLQNEDRHKIMHIPSIIII